MITVTKANVESTPVKGGGKVCDWGVNDQHKDRGT